MHRQTRKRIMERAGFSHVSGWVKTERAPALQEQIDQDKDAAGEALAKGST